MNCPRFQYLDFYCGATGEAIRLSSSREAVHAEYSDGGDPSISSQGYINCARFSAFLPTQEYLDLLSSHLSNMESIILTDRSPTTIDEKTFNLTTFKELKFISLNAAAGRAVRRHGGEDIFVPLFIRFKYTNGDQEEAF